MNHLDKLFGNPVQRIDAIILGMFKKELDLIEAEGGMENEIRRQKACIIEDIFRGYKIAQIYAPVASKAMDNPVWAFDKLYDLDLDALEAYNRALDKHNTDYMRKELDLHNRGENDPDKGIIWR